MDEVKIKKIKIKKERREKREREKIWEIILEYNTPLSKP